MMKNINKILFVSWWVISLLWISTAIDFAVGSNVPQKLELPAPPVLEGPWLRPGNSQNAMPVWGIKGGMEVGIWPTPGPRGLLRIYTPYLGQKRPRMVNFISIEPVIKRNRGQSELEKSDLDKIQGKAMWTSDELDLEGKPTSPTGPARGKIVDVDGTKALTFFVGVEQFRNGSYPIIQVTLRRDRPHEISLKVFSHKKGKAMDSCVLSATMGNYARLRQIWLAKEVIDSRKLWPKFEPDRLNFAPWRAWPMAKMLRVDEDAIVAATPAEKNPAATKYEDKVPPHWRYQGKWATQYWRSKAVKGLVVRVNGRTTYWGEQGKIPGGISYENFEMEAPYQAGQEFRFGIIPEGPEALGFGKSG